MPKAIVCCVILLIAVNAHAEDFGSDFEEGYELLRTGNPEGALASFKNLLTEDPDSQFVQYSIATALYEKGLKDLAVEVSEATLESLYQARDGFDALRNSDNPFLRQNAPFNAANCTTQVARHLDPHNQYSERVQALQNSIQLYETLLRLQPEHEGAKTNLNHARYLLKSMLQDPPPDQQQADDTDGDDGEQGKNDEQSEGQEGDEDNPDSQEGEEEPPPGDDQTEDSDSQSGGDPQDSSSDSQLMDDENIEAILQSLEEKNRAEQKNLRKAKGPPRVRGGKWW